MLLEHAFDFVDPLRYSRHWDTEGEKYYEKACRLGWEGLIAKRADAPSQSRRSHDWLKFKCEGPQEFVIGGFTAPKGKRTGLGALLLGYYENSSLRYAGKVGTGFDTKTLQQLSRRMASLQSKAPPFINAEEIRGDSVTWVRPTLVAEIGFTEWTTDGKLRHPRDLGSEQTNQRDRWYVSGLEESHEAMARLSTLATYEGQDKGTCRERYDDRPRLAIEPRRE
jgi:ATP-dependent DNA ligase